MGKQINALTWSGDTLYASIGGLGIYASTNNGSNWWQVFVSGNYIPSIIITGNNIFAGTNGGIYRSTNRGTNWSLVFNSDAIYSLTISGNTVYAGSNTYGVYLSTNNGTNWIQTSLNNISVRSLAALGSVIFAGLQDNGIYLSSNNGTSWTQVSTISMVNALTFSGNNICAGSQNSFYMSTNNGVSWSNVQLGSVYSLGASGNNIYAGTNSSIYISTNGGSSFTQSLTNSRYYYSIATNGSLVFVGSQNGLFSTSNNGQTWDMPAPSSIGAIIKSVNDLWAGTTDGVFNSSDGGLRWTYKNLSNNTTSLYLDGSYLFAGTAGQGVYYTTNAGANWTQTPLNNKNVNSLAKRGPNLIAATNNTGIYYSSNSGANWSQSSLTDITTKTLYVLDSNVYAGTVFGGVYVSTNNGATWAQSTLLYMDVNAFTSAGNRLYAGTSGSGVYYTTNAGANWTQTAFNNNTIISFTQYGSSLFAGTSGSGVYLTNNSGANWTQVNDGMGNVGVGALSTYGNYIIAGTGNGVWRRYILEFAPIRGDANLDSLVNVLDVTSIVSYILGNPPVPFSILAADVNVDTYINVLDVVGVVNIILHPTDRFFANKENRDASGTAYLELQNNNLRLHNTIPVAGIQFRLTGDNAEDVNFNPSTELASFQVSSGSTSSSSKTFIIYTMSDSALIAGVHTLGAFTGLNNGITIVDTVIADKDGIGILTGTGENGNNQVPHEYNLNQNYPNPFNPVTLINFSIPRSGFTSLKVFDITGKLIRTLMNEDLQAGYYKAVFDAGNLASGVYFYELTSGAYFSAKKMVVLK